MKRIQNVFQALGLVLVATAASSCQNMNSFFTGEKFSRAPEGSPRVETELTVRVDDAFVESFSSVEQAVELGGATSDLVLGLADVGTRFYPVRSEEYATKEFRPRYVMVVDIADLDFEFGEETVPGTGEGESAVAPSTRAVLRAVTCTASASIEKRRKQAPALVVGRSKGKGTVRVAVDPDVDDAVYTVSSDDGRAVSVRRDDVLEAVERAVVVALRDMVRAVDREFAVDRAGVTVRPTR